MIGKIPLYPNEDTIAVAVMGEQRAKDWPAKARYLEDKHGLPKVDELMGGRYWPAVIAFFNSRHGVGEDLLKPSIRGGVLVVPSPPDGKENFDEPPRRKKRPQR